MATDVDGVVAQLAGSSDLGGMSSNASIIKSIGKVIGVLQIVGTGIALIVVSMMGIKYMLASPSEKADTKKMITPVIIGCILLFGAVNLVAIVANFSDGAIK